MKKESEFENFEDYLRYRNERDWRILRVLQILTLITLIASLIITLSAKHSGDNGCKRGEPDNQLYNLALPMPGTGSYMINSFYSEFDPERHIPLIEIKMVDNNHALVAQVIHVIMQPASTRLEVGVAKHRLNMSLEPVEFTKQNKLV